ncbi:hypothetical protein RRG08_024442 [Elysia crispata]|uniref:Uncharacterized protein n=1 Tax=Elysia crispata TaxID=231223 RepID=A0AAE1D2S7_9GAST|nr:hypothetical protein RRG08_024442 [Elysia crispata]
MVLFLSTGLQYSRSMTHGADVCCLDFLRLAQVLRRESPQQRVKKLPVSEEIPTEFRENWAVPGSEPGISSGLGVIEYHPPPAAAAAAPAR